MSTQELETLDRQIELKKLELAQLETQAAAKTDGVILGGLIACLAAVAVAAAMTAKLGDRT